MVSILPYFHFVPLYKKLWTPYLPSSILTTIISNSTSLVVGFIKHSYFIKHSFDVWCFPMFSMYLKHIAQWLTKNKHPTRTSWIIHSMFKMTLKENIPILQIKKWFEAYGSLVNNVQYNILIQNKASFSKTIKGILFWFRTQSIFLKLSSILAGFLMAVKRNQL